MREKRSPRRAIGAIALVVGASLLLAGCIGTPATPARPLEQPAAGVLADYSFGHTVVTADQFASTPLDALQRLPLQLAVEPTSFRVHVRNWNYLADQGVPGSLTVTGVWLGQQASGDETNPAFSAEPALLAEGGTVTDGASYTTPWISTETVPISAHTPYLLSMGLRSDTGIAVAATGSAAWIDLFGASALAGSTDAMGQWNATASLLDVWIEYTVPDNVTTLFVIGHSLNSPGNRDRATHPHRGELDSWPQQWALSVDAAASTLAASGAWTLNYPPESPKWTTYGDAQPDYVAMWDASNDIANGQTLEQVQGSYQVVLARARQQWPDAVFYGFTEAPRSIPPELDSVRVAWNAWLLTADLGLAGVIDADAALRDPGSPEALDPELTSDGIHLNLAGHQLVAQLFSAAVSR